MKKVKIEIKNVKWDTDGKPLSKCFDNDGVPLSKMKNFILEIDSDYVDEHLSDYLTDVVSDVIGWCHFGFDYQIVL